MSGKTEVSKGDVAGGITSMSELLQRRLEIGDMLDQVIDELGVQFGLLNQVNKAIGRQAGSGKNSPPNIAMYTGAPSWIAESWTAEVLRNRLAMELAEHSGGGGNQTILGPVKNRETLVEVFSKNHEPFQGGR